MRLLILGLFTLVVAGCVSDRDVVVKPPPQQQAIEQTEQQRAALDRQRAAEQAAKVQAASDHVHAAATANTLNPERNRHTGVVAGELTAATVNLPAPSAEGLQAAASRLQLALSASESDRQKAEDLYKQSLVVADERDKRIKALESDLAGNAERLRALTAEREQWHAAQAAQAAAELAAAQQAAKAAEAAAAERSSRIAILLWVFGGIGAVCVLLGALAMAFWPLLSVPLFTAGGLCTALAVFAASAPEWVLWSGSAGVLVLVGVAAWLKYGRTRAVADNAIGAIQQLKDRPDEAAHAAYGELRKELTDWFGGKNHPLEAEIDRRLRQMNLK